MTINHGAVLIAISRGLLGVITEQLRFVTVDQNKHNALEIVFYYDDTLNRETELMWQGALNRIGQALREEYQVVTMLVRRDFPLPIPAPLLYAYYRLEAPSKGKAILAMQRALLGKISPTLRVATINWANDGNLLVFYFDGEISSEDRACVRQVLQEIEQMYPKYRLDCEIIRLDHPKQIVTQGEIVYQRYE